MLADIVEISLEDDSAIAVAYIGGYVCKQFKAKLNVVNVLICLLH